DGIISRDIGQVKNETNISDAFLAETKRNIKIPFLEHSTSFLEQKLHFNLAIVAISGWKYRNRTNGWEVIMETNALTFISVMIPIASETRS
ncbi:hypothetical protein BgiBS90_005917, partial [Biomphalaria glabrata]